MSASLDQGPKPRAGALTIHRDHRETLDPRGLLTDGTVSMLVTPTLSVPFAAGYPPGTTVYCQGLALEFGVLGTYYSFTQVEPVVIP